MCWLKGVCKSIFVWCESIYKARAKLELREQATEKDAKDVVEIMKYRFSGGLVGVMK